MALMLSATLLLNIVNKRGPGTEPWGTPDKALYSEDGMSLNAT